MDEKMCKCDSCGMEKMCQVGSKCECGGTMMEKTDEGGMDSGMGGDQHGGDMGGHSADTTMGGQQ